MHRGRLESINLERCCADTFCNIDTCDIKRVKFFMFFFIYFFYINPYERSILHTGLSLKMFYSNCRACHSLAVRNYFCYICAGAQRHRDTVTETSQPRAGSSVALAAFPALQQKKMKPALKCHFVSSPANEYNGHKAAFPSPLNEQFTNNDPYFATHNHEPFNIFLFTILEFHRGRQRTAVGWKIVNS